MGSEAHSQLMPLKKLNVELAVDLLTRVIERSEARLAAAQQAELVKLKAANPNAKKVGPASLKDILGDNSFRP
jgi:hypothetical protein